MIRHPRVVRRSRDSPLLALPSFRALAALPRSTLEPFGDVIQALRNDAAAQGPRSWQKRKAPMAAYWMAVAAHSGSALRALVGRCEVACPRLAERGSMRTQRNPLLALPECARLASIPGGERARLTSALARIRADAGALAEEAWRLSPDSAAYWRSVGVWVGHLGRAVAAVPPAVQHELLLPGAERRADHPASSP